MPERVDFIGLTNSGAAFVNFQPVTPELHVLGHEYKAAASVGWRELVYADQALSARVDMTLCFVVTLSLVLFYSLYRGFLTNPYGLTSFTPSWESAPWRKDR